MSLEKIVPTIMSLVFPFINSKAAKKIAGDLSEAANNTAIDIWDKIKPILIEEDEELLEDIKQNPEDEDYKVELELKIKRILKKNEELKAEIEKILNESKEGKVQELLIINSKNVVTGGIKGVTGNIHIGDNNDK